MLGLARVEVYWIIDVRVEARSLILLMYKVAEECYSGSIICFYFYLSSVPVDSNYCLVLLSNNLLLGGIFSRI